MPLRLSRRVTGRNQQSVVSYGEYFDGIRDVLLMDGCDRLCCALEQKLAMGMAPDRIQEIRIYAEKHGSDYHPARIEVMGDGLIAAFVMNVALTARGRERLVREFEVLRKLNRKPTVAFLPAVYFQGETHLLRPGKGVPPKGDSPAVMFLADWFEGFHEFHLSVDESNGRQGIQVWNTDRAAAFLSDTETWATYAGIARILTGYYDLETFRQIFPWHHAAGDFVIRVRDRSLDVRLITARQYAAMVEGVSVFDALLFFLLNLSFRTRLDRLDGVGDIVWAEDPSVVAATVAGFWDGVTLDAEAAGRFLTYVRAIEPEELLNRFEALMNASDPAAPDMPVIREHLADHANLFRREFDRFRIPSKAPRRSH